MRHEVDQLLLALWADPACKTSLVTLATDSGTATATSEDASGGVLVDYARAVLNDLMYLLKVGGCWRHARVVPAAQHALVHLICAVLTPCLSVLRWLDNRS